MSRFIFFATVLFAFGVCKAQAANLGLSSYFIGVTPSITAEPYYDAGEFDVNILPFVYQTSVFEKADIRMTSIVNYGIRKNESKLSHIGFEIAFPIRLLSQSSTTGPANGFFVAPIFSVTQEQIDSETHIGLWVEPGYQFVFFNNYSMSIGLQLGATWIDSDIASHLGVNFIIGKWL